MNIAKKAFLSLFLLMIFFTLASSQEKPLVGAYYFDGWAGHAKAGSNEEWAANAPSHLTKRLATEFADREPIWGWRDDDLRIMEKQIDKASANGIDFFLFCWYWRDDRKNINEEAIVNSPNNTAIRLFMKARNRNKMKFCILVANHQGSQIVGMDNWKDAMKYWEENYFRDPGYLKVDNQPMVVIFNSKAFRDDNAGEVGDEMMRQYGYDGLFSVGCSYRWPYKGFDMYSWYNTFPKKHFDGQEVDYGELTSALRESWQSIPIYEAVAPIVMSGWDPRPWRDKQDHSFTYYTNRTPQKFKENLDDAFEFLRNRNYKHKFIFIDAWNEMGEGSYLLPTKGDPKALYLKEIKKAKKEDASVEKGYRRLRTKDSLKVVCLGNSITRHGYLPRIGWYSEWGMAATNEESDYCHKIQNRLRKYNGSSSVIPWNISPFERDPGIDIDSMLKGKCDSADVIVIKIGENVRDSAAFDNNFQRLIDACRTYTDKIILVGMFWENSAMESIIKKHAKANNLTFVSLESVRSQKDIYPKIGDIYYDIEGKPYKIEQDFIITHPNDKGMEEIGRLIFNAIARLKLG